MPTADRTMSDLYRTLSAVERARLVARFVREDNMTEIRRVRDALPDSYEAISAYRRTLHIAADLPRHILVCTEALQRGFAQSRPPSTCALSHAYSSVRRRCTSWTCGACCPTP